MQSALHITAKVLPGNRIEVQLPSGSEGQEVDIFIVLPIANLPTNHQDQVADLNEMAKDPDIQNELAAVLSAEALTRIRNRPRVNPLEFSLPDSTDLIREDRDR
ncbi:hypothetical protein [Altericista sp. CCNU0014]|uniref:hypothetical protein n=1 Tax=Altericista sp. CCNU0014 TaxID=3082949 RepID=UPI00384D4E8C